VHTTVIELDSLTDPIGAAAEYHDFLAFASAGLVFFTVGGIVVRRVGFKLGRTGVNEAISWMHPLPDSIRAHIGFGRIAQLSKLPIRKAELLRSPKIERALGNVFFFLNDLPDVFQKP
jgi:hypothetical protein